MSNLLDMLKNIATPELISAASKSLGESEGGISKAIGGIMPSILSGVMNSNTSSHSMIGDLFAQAGSNSNLVGDLIGGLTSGNTNNPTMNIGSTLLKGLFGDKVAGIANLISSFSGIKAGSSNSLLGLGGSLVASFLGKKMIGEGLNFSGMMNWLGGHKNEIESVIPAGFSNLMSSNTVANAASTVTSAAHNVVSNSNDDSNGGGSKWLLPIILLGLLGVGLFMWLKGCNKESELTKVGTEISGAAHSIDDAANHAAANISAGADSLTNAVSSSVEGALDEAGNWIAKKGEAIKLKLSNGVEIDATKGSLEDRLYAFINDPAAQAGKDIWFNFEDLLFDTGKSTLKASSAKQLENTVAILKAYPAVKVKLGGYTDNTGDSLSNVKLSDARAKSVYNQMINKGLTNSSFDEKAFEGYGPMHPVADNATPEGRGQNRRISISVRAK